MNTVNRVLCAMTLAASCNVSAFETSTHAVMTVAAAGKSRLGVSPSYTVLTRSLGLRDYNYVFGYKYIDIGPHLATREGGGFERKILDDVQKAYPGQIPDAYTLTGWLMRGAIREDDNPVEVETRFQDEPGGTFARVFGHFYDPQNDRALTVPYATNPLGPRTPLWALVDGATIPRTNVGPVVLNENVGANHYNVRSTREAMWRALTLKAVAPDGSLTDNATPCDILAPTLGMFVEP